MNTNARHRIWIRTINSTVKDNLYSVSITYCSNVTKESVVEGLESVRERVAAFKTLYDGDFEVISDVNFT